MSHQSTIEILQKKFDARHSAACVQYYDEAAREFASSDYEAVALKAGKFVEALTKALMVFCHRQVPDNTRQFKAGNELRTLEQFSAFPDTVRLVIPKASIFIYEVVNNRGGRHDSTEINANEMDARVVMPVMSWILAEMVRFASDVRTTDAAMNLIDGITNKTYPFFEEIEGRTYVNLESAKAPDVALLLLYDAYPEGITRAELIPAIVRHGHKENAASMAVHRLRDDFDDNGGLLRLRGTGRQKAESLIEKFQKRQIKKR